MKLVSVIIPVYNGGKYIEEAVKSILNQTYKNLEIIIINDGSTDDTFLKLQQLKKNDNRIVIHNRENQGLIKTLNFALDIAKGEYIARMDADDISLPSRIEKQVIHLTKNPKLIACGTQFKRFGKVNNISSLPVSSDDCELTLLFSTPLCHPSVMFCTNKYRYKIEYIHSEDYKFWCDLSSIGKIENINEVLLKYRIHDCQVSKVHSKKQVSKQVDISKEMIISKFNLEPNQCYLNVLSSFVNKDYFNKLKQDERDIILKNIIYILPFFKLKGIIIYIKICFLLKTFKLNKIVRLIMRYIKWFNLSIKS